MRNYCLLTRFLVIGIVFLSIPIAQSHAQLTFDLTLNDDGGPPSTLGDFLIANRDAAEPEDVVMNGITFGVNATSTINDDGATFNSISSNGIGVDTNNASFGEGDFGTAAINVGEELTFTLSFEDDLSLTNIDFNGIGTESDSATVSIAGGPAITVFNGFGSEFDEVTEVYTPATPVELASGDTIVFSSVATGTFNGVTNGAYSIQGFSFSTEAGAVPSVPEPNSIAILGLTSLLALGRRRRS